MNNKHEELHIIVLLDYTCISKDYKCSYNMNYEEYPLMKYVIKAS